MKCFLVVAALVLAVASPAHAAPIVNYFTPADTGVNGALLSGAPTFTLRVDAFSKMAVTVALTRVAATGLVITCQAGPTASVLGPMSVATPTSAGPISMSDATFVWTGVSTSRRFRAIVGPLLDSYVSCAITGTGATSDTVSAHVRAIGGV